MKVIERLRNADSERRAEDLALYAELIARAATGDSDADGDELFAVTRQLGISADEVERHLSAVRGLGGPPTLAEAIADAGRAREDYRAVVAAAKEQRAAIDAAEKSAKLAEIEAKQRLSQTRSAADARRRMVRQFAYLFPTEDPWGDDFSISGEELPNAVDARLAALSPGGLFDAKSLRLQGANQALLELFDKHHVATLGGYYYGRAVAGFCRRLRASIRERRRGELRAAIVPVHRDLLKEWEPEQLRNVYPPDWLRQRDIPSHVGREGADIEYWAREAARDNAVANRKLAEVDAEEEADAALPSLGCHA